LKVFKRKSSDEHEFRIHSEWASLKSGTRFSTIGGVEVELLSPGIWNNEPGPDFINAKAVIGGRVLSGDIEIHRKSSDWVAHGHQKNPGYLNVILHVVRKHDVKDFNISSIPNVIVFPTSLKIPASEHFVGAGLCGAFFSSGGDVLARIADSAGRERFLNKSDKILKEMMAIGSDMAFLGNIFDAAGYKKNRGAFSELFVRLSKYSQSELMDNFDVIIWGESTLLPDASDKLIPEKTRAFATDIWEKWWKLRYSASAPVSWSAASSRPHNTPERRIAAICAFVKKHPVPMLKRWTEIITVENTWDCLKARIMCRDELWDGFRNFKSESRRPVAILGESFALELAINIILPSVHAYARLHKDVCLEEKAFEIWSSLPPEPLNNVLSKAYNKWFIPPSSPDDIIDSAARTQGVLHLYKEYCCKNSFHCVSCPLLQSLKSGQDSVR